MLYLLRCYNVINPEQFDQKGNFMTHENWTDRINGRLIVYLFVQ